MGDAVRRRSAVRGSIGFGAVFALVASLLTAFGSVTVTWAASAAPPPRDKVQPKLLKSFETDPRRAFWIRFDQRADLSRAEEIDDWDERGAYVYQQLAQTADASQRHVRTMLDARGIDYQPYLISNAIHVENGSRNLAINVAAADAVESVRAPSHYELIEPVEREPAADLAPDTVEWGIANINADDVWAQFGVTGEGITVASNDSGVQFDHPALVSHYRGNTGNGTFDHNYNWFDAAGNCPAAPCDLNGHGTHTMGTMVGDDGAGNQIGVAPGAKWIAANGCCPNDQALIASGEWLLAPRDLAGTNPDPSRRP